MAKVDGIYYSYNSQDYRLESSSSSLPTCQTAKYCNADCTAVCEPKFSNDTGINERKAFEIEITQENRLSTKESLKVKNIQEVKDSTRVLVENAGTRKIEVTKSGDGSVTITLNPSKITHLTFSGGGTKGVIYPMCVKILQQLDLWNPIKSLSGTSVGSQITLFAGIGMDYKQIEERLKAIKPYSVFYRKQKNAQKIHWKSKPSVYEKEIKIEKAPPIEKESNKGLLAIIFKIIISFIWDRVIQKIINLIAKLSSNCKMGDKLEEYLNLVVAEVLLEKIENLNDEDQFVLKDIISTLKAQQANPDQFNSSLTFKQLDELSKFLPEIKDIEITGTALFEGKSQLVMFNKLNHPDMPVATAARISSSFPRVFPTYKIKSFLSTEEDVEFTDGGCMLNTPSRKIVYKHKRLGLMDSDNELILVFEKRKKSDRKTDEYKIVNFGIKDALKEVFAFNTPVMSSNDQLNVDLHKFDDSVYEVSTAFEFNGETIYNGTFNIFISEEDIDRLQQQGEQSFIDYLENRVNSRLKFQFNNLKEALFNFNDSDFQDVCIAMPIESNQVMNMRNIGNEVLKSIKDAIDNYDADNNPKEEKIQSLIMLLHQLDKDFSQEDEFIEWFSELINDTDDIKLSRFLDLTKNDYESSDSIFLQKAHEKRNKIFFRNRIEHLIDTKINPKRYNIFQSITNQKLLTQTKVALLNATSESDVQQIMKGLEKNYVPTLLDISKKTTNDMLNSMKHL